MAADSDRKPMPDPPERREPRRLTHEEAGYIGGLFVPEGDYNALGLDFESLARQLAEAEAELKRKAARLVDAISDLNDLKAERAQQARALERLRERLDFYDAAMTSSDVELLHRVEELEAKLESALTDKRQLSIAGRLDWERAERAKATAREWKTILKAWPAEANCWPLKDEDFDRRRMLVERTDAALGRSRGRPGRRLHERPVADSADALRAELNEAMGVLESVAGGGEIRFSQDALSTALRAELFGFLGGDPLSPDYKRKALSDAPEPARTREGGEETTCEPD